LDLFRWLIDRSWRSEAVEAVRSHGDRPPVLFCGRGESERIVRNQAGCAVGIVVTPENPPELAAAMSRLADDAELRKELGRCGRALAENSFDRDAIAIAMERELTDQ